MGKIKELAQLLEVDRKSYDTNLNTVLDLVKSIFPDVTREGFSVHLGSIAFEPIIKRGSDSDHSVIGVNVQTNYSWTPVRKVMLKSDGTLDAAKLKAAVKDQQDIIKATFDKEKGISHG